MQQKYLKAGLWILSAAALMTACRPTVPTPKKNGYFRLALPKEHHYQIFDSRQYPFTFEFPVYGRITQDTNLNIMQNAQYWFNIVMPSLNATIYMSYKKITPTQSVSRLINESYTLTHAHDIRADYIKSPDFTTSNGLSGTFYTVGGNAASFYQFYATDSVHHFIRGALYFNVTPNADSLKPLADFLRTDMQHLVESLKFRN